MLIIPIYDMMMLPGVTFHFKSDIFEKMGYTDVKEGDEVFFLMLREDKERIHMFAEDFYPVGLSGRVETVDEERNIRIRTGERVDYHDVDVNEQEIQVAAVHRPELLDADEEQEQEALKKVRQALISYVRPFQWGAWARGYFLHWKNMNELLCAVAAYLPIGWEDKYTILQTDSRRERDALIEKTILECIEINRVSEEAENAQKQSNEQLYRESAIKKQIEILQKQLDAMHPENVSDVRRFELKIQESG